MPGKLTVLDRLISAGKINKTPFGNAKYAVDELSFPSIREMGGKLAGGTARKMTPEREVYQRGIAARMQPKYLKSDEDVSNADAEMEDLQNEWSTAIDDAKAEMLEDWENGLGYESFDTIDPDYLEVEVPGTNLRAYWPSHARTPDEIYEDFDAAQDRYNDALDVQHALRQNDAWMREQMMTPRYRNYQRVMAQRAANKRMGHDLSRRYATAFRNLLRRGLSPEEADAYVRKYFGGY